MNLCDELRYISRVDTQARSLSICSQVMHFIGYGSIHTKLLEAKLQEWSQSMYKTSEEYRKHNGILTRETKEGFLTSTKAYPVYLDLLEKLGLIVFVKEIIRLSKFGRVFVHLTEESQAFLLSDTEKILFLFFLFQRDADALISVMEIVNQGSSNINRIYSTFEEHFKIRLEQKMYFSNTRAKMAISERLRKINEASEREEAYNRLLKSLEKGAKPLIRHLGNNKMAISTGSAYPTVVKVEGFLKEELNEDHLDNREDQIAYILNADPEASEEDFEDMNDEQVKDEYLKIEKKEKPELAALREVEEETGVKAYLGKLIGPTWHTYYRSDKYYLKKTSWYAMDCLDDKNIKPQSEEEITALRWMTKNEAIEAAKKTYRSIDHVISQYYKL